MPMEPIETYHQEHYFTTDNTSTTPSPTSICSIVKAGSPTPCCTLIPLDPATRKRWRPRKYGTPEQAMSAKKTASLSSKEWREQQQLALGGTTGSLSGSSKKSQLVALGNAGQSYTHIINVVTGEILRIREEIQSEETMIIGVSEEVIS